MRAAPVAPFSHLVLVAAIAALTGAAPGPASSDEVPGSEPAAAESTEGDGAFGLRFDSDRPVSIRSDQLESSQVDGKRKLLFTENVVVVQDDLTIRSQRLEAIYPPKTSQPSRMVATGHVRLSNGSREARCDEATYLRETDVLTCRGNAELQDGEDCVSGRWIAFDLTTETVKVGGGAIVVLGDESCGSGPEGGA